MSQSYGGMQLDHSWGSALLSGGFVELGGDFHAAQALGVLGDAAVERLGNALAVVAGPEAVLVCGIADEGDLGEDRGHVGTDEDDERGLLHAAIADGGAFGG